VTFKRCSFKQALKGTAAPGGCGLLEPGRGGIPPCARCAASPSAVYGQALLKALGSFGEQQGGTAADGWIDPRESRSKGSQLNANSKVSMCLTWPLWPHMAIMMVNLGR